MVPIGGEMKKQSIREKNRVLLDENLEKVRAINWPATNSGWGKDNSNLTQNDGIRFSASHGIESNNREQS
jgi:hypothetical protein